MAQTGEDGGCEAGHKRVPRSQRNEVSSRNPKLSSLRTNQKKIETKISKFTGAWLDQRWAFQAIHGYIQACWIHYQASWRRHPRVTRATWRPPGDCPWRPPALVPSSTRAPSPVRPDVLFSSRLYICSWQLHAPYSLMYRYIYIYTRALLVRSFIGSKEYATGFWSLAVLCKVGSGQYREVYIYFFAF